MQLRKRNIKTARAMAFIAALGVGLAACSLPEHMEVRAGIDPRNQDDDVRFRTTYYFRVFDACEGIGETEVKNEGGTNPFIKNNKGPYNIAIDSLYRFRMTGKANSLFTKVHFESGTLHKSEIDPLGAAVVFDEKSGRFHFESREQTEAAAARDRQFEELDRMLREYDRLKRRLRDDEGNFDTEEKQLLSEFQKVIRGQIIQIGGTNLQSVISRMNMVEEAKNKLEKLRDELKSALADARKADAKTDQVAVDAAKKETISNLRNIVNKQADAARTAISSLIATASGADVNVQTAVESAVAFKTAVDNAAASETIIDPKAAFHEIDKMVTAYGEAINQLRDFNVTAAAKDAMALECGDARRGFQILGPEGWRTFNQDERLILAMTTSAKPLISALKELSGRVLNEQPTRGAMLLPLVEERLRIVRAERVLDRLQTGSLMATEDALAMVIEEFDPDSSASGKPEDEAKDDN